MNKIAVLQSILDSLRAEFEILRNTSVQTRAAGNDEESKAEGKYDTRSIEDNYLADGLARQAQRTAESAEIYTDFPLHHFQAGEAVEMGALVQLEFPDECQWFFLGPAAGGIEVECAGEKVIVITPESPLAGNLLGLKAGDRLDTPKAVVRQVL